MRYSRKITLAHTHLTFSESPEGNGAAKDGALLLSMLRSQRVSVTSDGNPFNLMGYFRMQDRLRAAITDACFAFIDGAAIAWAVQHGQPIEYLPETSDEVHAMADDLFLKIQFPLFYPSLTRRLREWVEGWYAGQML